MEIYNKYGAITKEVSERLWNLERELYPKFASAFPEASLPELRTLFHEFCFGMSCGFSEDLLSRATVMLKMEKK
jgi:hypothetical protein